MTIGVRRKMMVLPVLAALFLSGCASLSEEECLMGDWRAVGFTDATKGHALSRFEEHRKACARHGVAADLETYRDGHEDGARVYCQPDNGFQVGVAGRAYRGICPPDLAGPFLAAYEAGRELYVLRDAVEDLDDEISDFEDEIFDVEQRIRDLEEELVDGAGGQKARQVIVDEIRSLRRRRRDLEDEIARLDEERLWRMMDLEHAEDDLLGRY